MRIVGIDPGMRLTGYGCVDCADGLTLPCLVEAGVLRFDQRGTLEQRLVRIAAEVGQLLDDLTPDRLAVEKLYAHYRHPRTAIVMGHARGVILLAAAQRDLAIEHLPSTEVKKSITGNGHASKQQVQLAVQSCLSLAEPPAPYDVADAIAIAMCAARRVLHQRTATL